MVSDALLGKLVVISSSIFFIYYTTWVVVLPFADDHMMKSLFPSVQYALMIPAIMGLCFIGGLMVFTAYAMRK